MCNLPAEAALDVERVVFGVLEVADEVVHAADSVVVRRALLQVFLEMVQLDVLVLQLLSQLGLALLQGDDAPLAVDVEEESRLLELAFAA